jgi:hypothetical protein
MYRNLLLLCALALSLSCTNQSQTTSNDAPQAVKTLTRASAAKMIASSAMFTDKSCPCDKPVNVGQLNKNGWYPPRSMADRSPLVKVPPNPELIKPNGWLNWLYTEGYLVVKGYELVPSEKGNSVMRPVGDDWVAPLATVQLSEVTGIKDVAFLGVKGIKEAEFTCHYVLTPLGKEVFKVGHLHLRVDPNQTYKGTAMFELYDDDLPNVCKRGNCVMAS